MTDSNICKHIDSERVSYRISADTVWMKCDCGEEWTGQIPWWIQIQLLQQFDDEEEDNYG